MTQLWMDGFEHYGERAEGVANMLNGSWAEIQATDLIEDAGPVVPDFPVRGGRRALRLTSQTADFARRVLGGSRTNVIAASAVYLPNLPDLDNRLTAMAFLSAGRETVATLFIQSDGRIVVRGRSTLFNGWRSAPILASTPGPVIRAGEWEHVEAQLVVSATVGSIEVRVNRTQVLLAENIDTGTIAVTQMFVGTPNVSVGTPSLTPRAVYYDDIVVRDNQGSVNNGFEGDLRIAYLQPIANGVAQGWTARTIRNLGSGVMNFLDTNNNEAVTFADNSALRIGAQDYTIEGFYRFESTPQGNAGAILFSKYRNATDDREWRLILNGPDIGSNLVFTASTDGQFSSLQTIHDHPFVPELNRWYHFAVSRSGGVSRMFIDGQQVGVDRPDSLTYYQGPARLHLNNQDNGSEQTFDNLSVDGWADAFRVTIGASRYSANFTPPTGPLGTSLDDDPLYGSVQVLMNFDDSPVVDQSQNNFTPTLVNNAFVSFPTDENAFETVDGTTPVDVNFVEAALRSATATLTLTTNALDGEQVVIGTTTYTLQTTLVDTANNVLIGADAEATLDNLLAAVNNEAGEGTLYGTGTLQNTLADLSDLPDQQVLATARTAGSLGNTVATTTTVTGASWSTATLTGGADIPGPTEFTLSALPPDVTGVRAVATVARAFKTDSGQSELQLSFVEQSGSSSQGTSREITTNPSYYEDTFETDPATSGAITPSTLRNARIRLNRTV